MINEQKLYWREIQFSEMGTFIQRDICFIIFVITVKKYCPAEGNFVSWIPETINRTDMVCPVSCNYEKLTSRENCCACNALPTWKIELRAFELKVEYVKRDGTATVRGIEETTSMLLHERGFLTRLPLNVCDFRIVDIFLKHNFIKDIQNISCLRYLDTLDLSYNSISFLQSDIIVSLPLLRVLNLSNNIIQIIEPFSLAGTNIAIFTVDMSFNKLTDVDISNIIPEHRFCSYNFKNNYIKHITNYDNFKIDVSKVYHGGFVELDSNFLTRFLVWEDIGVDDIRKLGKVMEFGFSLKDMKWECDCRMESYLELSDDTVNRMWRDYFNITCWDPPEYRGYSIPDYFLNGNRLDLLICNVSSADKCPRKCHCYEQPKNRRTVVNCTSAGLTSLPNYVPDGNNLTLIFKNNSIKILEDKEYFNRSSSIDLSSNAVQTITDDIFRHMGRETMLDLSDNPIIELPRAFQIIDPCSSPLGTLTFRCDCRHSWLKDWVKNKKAATCGNTTELFCLKNGITMTVVDMNWNEICADNDKGFLNVLFIILLTVVLGAAILLYLFRFEILILTRNLKKSKAANVHQNIKYDVFVSFMENNQQIRRWAVHCLDNSLRTSGYKTFIPCRDEIGGKNREEALIHRISCSKNYVVVLSEKYSTMDSLNTFIEWKHIWNNYKRHPEKKILIINYDQMESSCVDDKRIKAMLILRLDIDFANRKHRLIKDVKRRLGHPLKKSKEMGNAVNFSKTANDLFIIELEN